MSTIYLLLAIMIGVGTSSLVIGFFVVYKESKRYRAQILEQIREIEKQIDEEIEALGISDLRQTLPGRRLLELQGMQYTQEDWEIRDVSDVAEKSFLGVISRFEETVSQLEKKIALLDMILIRTNKNLARLENAISSLESEDREERGTKVHSWSLIDEAAQYKLEESPLKIFFDVDDLEEATPEEATPEEVTPEERLLDMIFGVSDLKKQHRKKQHRKKGNR